MKTTRSVSISMLLGAMLVGSTTRMLGASAADDNAVFPTRPSCCSQRSASVTNALANVSACTTAEATLNVECGDATKTHMVYFGPQSDALPKATNQTKPRNTVTYFTEAVISVGKVGENRQSRDRDAATIGEATISRSFAGREETREPRGLRLLSWNW